MLFAAGLNFLFVEAAGVRLTPDLARLPRGGYEQLIPFT